MWHFGGTDSISVSVLQKLREEPWTLPIFEDAHIIKCKDVLKEGVKLGHNLSIFHGTNEQFKH